MCLIFITLKREYMMVASNQQADKTSFPSNLSFILCFIVELFICSGWSINCLLNPSTPELKCAREIYWEGVFDKSFGLNKHRFVEFLRQKMYILYFIIIQY